MTRPQSLRRRIVGAFSVFAVVLIAVMVACFHILLHLTQDRVLVKQLEVEMDDLLSAPDRLDRPAFDVGRYMRAYVGLGSVPAELRERLEPMEPGVYEIGGLIEPTLDREIHVLVRALDGRAELLYLVFDATSMNPLLSMGLLYLSAVLVALLMVGLVGASTGRILAGRVIAPVTALAQELRTGSMETLGDRVEPSRYGDELGVLAEALVDAAERLRGFIVREREFTANASHELRTPLTVIRGAAELMQAQITGDATSLQRTLARIHRAVAAMEETIEVFLALAREGELAAPEEGCSAAAIVAEVVELHRRLLADRPVGVVVQVGEAERIDAPPRVLAIVLGNLVGNAFRRTMRGSVTITCRDGRLEVVDTGPGMPQEFVASATARHVGTGEGHGLGLSIVAALCERFGWRLEVESAEGAGTRAVLLTSGIPVA